MNPATIKIFNSVYERLEPYHALLKNYTPVIAFSGGRDSMLLFYFYKYLSGEGRAPAPVVYHLDHSIRNNAGQEESIAGFIDSSGFKGHVKKKIFLK